jgi:hypothetical protein
MTWAEQWGHLLERGTLNEIRVTLMQVAADAPPNSETLHNCLTEALDAMFERGALAGRTVIKQRLERFLADESSRLPDALPADLPQPPGTLQ